VAVVCCHIFLTFLTYTMRSSEIVPNGSAEETSQTKTHEDLSPIIVLYNLPKTFDPVLAARYESILQREKISAAQMSTLAPEELRFLGIPYGDALIIWEHLHPDSSRQFSKLSSPGTLPPSTTAPPSTAPSSQADETARCRAAHGELAGADYTNLSGNVCPPGLHHLPEAGFDPLSGGGARGVPGR
jgi:hypothetical protein